MLCKGCLSIVNKSSKAPIFSRRRKERKFHSTIEQLHALTSKLCGLCIIIKEHLNGTYRSYAPLEIIWWSESSKTAPNVVFELHGKGLESPEVLCAIQIKPLESSYLKVEELSSNTGDPQAVRCVAKWFEDCKTKHKNCRQLPPSTIWYPARLLDLTEHDPRLLITRDEKPSSPQYATLSYCWGRDPKHLTLKSSNISQLRTKIAWNTLSKTFQDAIHVARELGIFYLWIDSICIIQEGEDSKEDWLEQSRSMADIYAYGSLNISADWATNAEEGCFRDRDWEILSSAYFDWRGRRNILVVQTIDERLEAISSWRRAWVFQEHTLSPRTIHFTRNEVFWRCCQLELGRENLPDNPSTPVGVKLMVDQSYMENDEEWRANWRNTVIRYSSCEITYPDKDKLQAFSSVAKRYMVLFETGYAAGLLTKALPLEMCWQVTQAWGSRGTPSAGEYRAPSWSWASIDGPIKRYPWWDYRSLVAIKNVAIELLDPQNPTGPVKSALLTVEASFLADWLQKKIVQTLAGKLPEYYIFMVSWDSGSTPQQLHQVSFLPLINTDGDYRGKAVTRHSADPQGSFIRVGFFSFTEQWCWQQLKGKDQDFEKCLGPKQIINLV